MMSLFFAHSDFFSVAGKAGFLNGMFPVPVVCGAPSAKPAARVADVGARPQVCGRCRCRKTQTPDCRASPRLVAFGDAAAGEANLASYVSAPPHGGHAMRPVTAALLAAPLALALAAAPALAQSGAVRRPDHPVAQADRRRAEGRHARHPPRQRQGADGERPGGQPERGVRHRLGRADAAGPRDMLDQLGRALTSQDLAQYRFRIEGHTDTVGTAEANKALSQRRADAVAAYLQQHFGVAADRLQSVGMGEEGLAVPTPPQTANAQNRRVRVVNQDAAGSDDERLTERKRRGMIRLRAGSARVTAGGRRRAATGGFVMRSIAKHALVASLIAAPLALPAAPAAAQNKPSADQIIQSLKPSGDLLKGGTRGIRLANPTGRRAATRAGRTAAWAAGRQAAAAGRRAPSVSLTVEFASGSAELTPQARQTLDQLGTALTSSDLAQFRFRIEGHTDTVGSPDANKALSQRRADAVAPISNRISASPARGCSRSAWARKARGADAAADPECAEPPGEGGQSRRLSPPRAACGRPCGTTTRPWWYAARRRPAPPPRRGPWLFGGGAAALAVLLRRLGLGCGRPRRPAPVPARRPPARRRAACRHEPPAPQRRSRTARRRAALPRHPRRSRSGPPTRRRFATMSRRT